MSNSGKAMSIVYCTISLNRPLPRLHSSWTRLTHPDTESRP
jgi:hypothetical protein